MESSAFNLVRSGASQRQSMRRSRAIVSRTPRNVSSQRSQRSKARMANTASAFSSSQYIALLFNRWLITRRIVLSIAPLPQGMPRRRNSNSRSSGKAAFWGVFDL